MNEGESGEPEASPDRLSRAMHGIRRGYVFWLYGLSGAGKSTLAAGLQYELGRRGLRPLMLDGDRLRSGLCAGLGFSEADRAENLRRAAETARLAVESGLVTVAAFITPREGLRTMVREIVGAECVSLVQLDAPLAVCQARDVKGLYRRAADGKVPHMTGMSSAFEFSASADLALDTAGTSPAECLARLVGHASGRLGLVA